MHDDYVGWVEFIELVYERYTDQYPGNQKCRVSNVEIQTYTSLLG